MIKLNLTVAELGRLLEVMDSLPQADEDRELMTKLWAAQKRVKRKRKSPWGPKS